MRERRHKCATTGKQSWAKEKQAKGAAAVQMSKRGGQLYVYKCPFCSHWHLTKQPGSKHQREVSMSACFICARTGEKICDAEEAELRCMICGFCKK